MRGVLLLVLPLRCLLEMDRNAILSSAAPMWSLVTIAAAAAAAVAH